jgi:hypothetical protein
MLDAILDWALVFLPTVLSVVGVLVSIKAPHSKHHRTWRISLVIVGLLVSGVTLWQQARARSSHAAEVTSLNTKIADLSSTIRGLGGTLKTIETNTGQPPKVEVHVPPSKSPVVVVTPQSKPQRMLGIEQREKLVSILKGATPISITVLHAQGDHESQVYADFFVSSFKEAGWTILEPGVLLETRQGEGVRIAVHEIKTAPQGAILLQNALKEIGVDAQGWESPLVPVGSFWLYVGVQR